MGKLEKTSHGALPTVWFSFSRSALPNIINIKPYRFNKQYEGFHTDTTDGAGTQGNRVPLSLPRHSTIARSSCKLQENNALIEFSAVNKMITMAEAGQAHIAVVYGIHHPKADPSITLENCLHAITEQYRNGGSPYPGLPLFIAVFTNTMKGISETLRRLQERFSVQLIDLIDDVTGSDKPSESALERIASLGSGEIAIAEMPSLAKPVFERLISCSDYTVLTEGANLTAFLLQTGRASLSLVPFWTPYGTTTPVPQDIGYLFEAIRALAASYKLRHTEAQSKKLRLLKKLAEEEKYQEVLDLITSGKSENALQYYSMHYWKYYGYCESLNGASRYPSRYLLEEAPVTIKSLLEKAIARQKNGQSLGQAGKKALIQALTPGPEELPAYIDDCLNPDSQTSWHFKLMQYHINQPVNNSVAMACVKFARHKGICPPYLSKNPEDL